MMDMDIRKIETIMLKILQGKSPIHQTARNPYICSSLLNMNQTELWLQETQAICHHFAWPLPPESQP